MIQKLLFSFIILFLPSLILAQYAINGTVVDEKEESLAFVNVTINEDDSKGVIADVDGRFEIEHEEAIELLTFTYIGYETLDYTLSEEEKSKGDIIVQLAPSDFGLNEVVVKAGENPAHRIIREAVKNKKKNNHGNLSTYQCEVYSKMTFGYVLADSLKYQVAQEKLEKERKEKKQESKKEQLSFYDIHLFISEVVTERKFKFPETVKNKLLHSRVSGMKKMDLSVLNASEQFAFYDDFISFGEEDFVNPISKGSTQLYFFNVEDTLYQAADTIFLVSFKPKRNKVFEALKGTLFINTNGYAVQNVVAEPAGADKISWKIEHKYVFIDNEHWFPEQLNFEVIMPDLGTDYSDIRMTQKSYVSKVLLNPKFEYKDLKDNYIALKGDVISREDSIWNEHRVEPLSKKELRSYELVDSIGDKMKLDILMQAAVSFSTGRYSIKGVDIILKDVLRLNNYEKVRLGIGLQTNKDFSRYFSVGGHIGYGFKDKGLKYGGNMVVDIIPDDLLEIKYAFHNEILEPGLFSFNFQDDVLVTRNIYAQIMDKEIKHTLSLQSRYQFLRTNISLEKSILETQFPYSFQTELGNNNRFNFTELSAQIRYAFGENNNWFMGTKISSSTKYPILTFGYTKGFDNLLGGEFDYHKFSLAVEQKFNTRFLGATNYRIEGGLVKNDVPLSKLFIGNGADGAFSFVVLDHTFQTMKNYEFVGDRFVNLFLEHDFGNVFIRKKYSKPRLVLLHNMGYGKLDKPEIHYLDAESIVQVRDWSKGFFESGIGLDNLIVIPLIRSFDLGLGARVYYRYGAYQLEKQKDNIAIRGNINIVF